MKGSSKRFFYYLNSKRKIRQNIAKLKTDDDNETSSPTESANVLANFFSSTFTREPFGPLPKAFYDNNGSSGIHNNGFTMYEDDVKGALSKLNHFKSLGPDKVHPKLLSSLAEDSSFVNALTKLFNNCFQTGEIPAV